jgi:hypothetical protein
MQTPQFVNHQKISLRNHPTLSEKWLQDIIAADPSILGLGDLELIDSERIQEPAGRLDLLLSGGKLRVMPIGEPFRFKFAVGPLAFGGSVGP